MKNKYIGTLLFVILLALCFGSLACSSTKATIDSSPSNNHQEAIVTNSNTTDVPSAGAAEKKAPEITAQTVIGKYRFKTYKPNEGGNDNTLEISDTGSGKLHVSIEGVNMYMANGEETMHEASGEGDAELKGNIAIARLTPDGNNNNCRVTLTFIAANQVKLAAAKDCNFNVLINGTYTKESKTASSNDQAKISATPEANLPKISFDKLEDFVNDFNKNKTGKSFIITDIPAEKIATTKRADGPDGSANLKGLYYFQTNDDDTAAATMFIGSAALYKDYKAKVEYEPAKLRATAVLVEFKGEFDIYRGSFITKIEGLDDSGKATWTITGTPPAKVSFRQ